MCSSDLVGNPLGVGACPPPRGEPLELGLDPGQDTGVEKLGDPGVAHESGDRVRVQGQQAGAALGVRQVLLVTLNLSYAFSPTSNLQTPV